MLSRGTEKNKENPITISD